MRSLSEIETAVKRASRAVGFSWGNSEEVGKSIRQLELFGLQGIKNLNKYYKDKSKDMRSSTLIPCKSYSMKTFKTRKCRQNVSHVIILCI